jgi:hypothetical protein
MARDHEDAIDADESRWQAIDDFDRCDFFELRRFLAIPPQDPCAQSLVHEFICHEGTCRTDRSCEKRLVPGLME